MTDYNDGEWHRHCGNVMPDEVHPNSIVQVRLLDPDLDPEWGTSTDIACRWLWGDCGGQTIIAYRVVKECKEPREFLIYKDIAYTTRLDLSGEIHVREVLE